MSRLRCEGWEVVLGEALLMWRHEVSSGTQTGAVYVCLPSRPQIPFDFPNCDVVCLSYLQFDLWREYGYRS